jgi:hypothetical protein
LKQECRRAGSGFNLGSRSHRLRIWATGMARLRRFRVSLAPILGSRSQCILEITSMRPVGNGNRQRRHPLPPSHKLKAGLREPWPQVVPCTATAPATTIPQAKSGLAGTLAVSGSYAANLSFTVLAISAIFSRLRKNAAVAPAARIPKPIQRRFRFRVNCQLRLWARLSKSPWAP